MCTDCAQSLGCAARSALRLSLSPGTLFQASLLRVHVDDDRGFVRARAKCRTTKIIALLPMLGFDFRDFLNPQGGGVKVVSA